MKEPNAYKVIEGTFAPQDAMHILMEMINNKINYHNLRVFSIKERFNEDTTHSEKRIEELGAMAKALRKVLSNAEMNEQLVEINCTINLTMKEKKRAVTRKSKKQSLPL